MLPNIEISHSFYIYSFALFLTILSQLAIQARECNFLVNFC